MNILCIIPARGGSKRLKGKNIILVQNIPIIGYTIKAAFESKLLNKVVVSTDNRKIAAVAVKFGAQVISRPRKFATDTSPIEQTLRHAVEYLQRKEKYLADIVVWLQANVPIRKKGQIDNVIRRLLTGKADSAVTVYQVSQYPLWMKRMDRNGFLYPLRRNIKKYLSQDVEPLYLLDGAIVAMRREPLLACKGRLGAHIYLGKKTIGVIQEKKYTIEVDEEEDLRLARFYLEGEGIS